MSRILIVDDDVNLLELLGFALSKTADHEVTKVQLAQQALSAWRDVQPDLVVLDVNMPDGDGFQLCKAARAEGLTAPVIVLTARTKDEDMAEGFAVGADDYVTKPFRPDILIARIAAVLRRTGTASQDEGALESLALGQLALSPDTLEFSRGGNRVRLTPTEFRLLHALLTSPNKVIRSEVIIDRIWGKDTSGENGSLKAHIRHLREKVEKNPSLPDLIVTVPGVGYMARVDKAE